MSTGETKYGWIRGGAQSYPLPMGADEVLYAKSGRFVKNDASGRGEVAGNGHTRLMGWVEAGNQTCSSSESGTVLKCICDVTAVFRLPLAYFSATYTVNYADSLIGTKHDLVVINGIQYANLTDSDENVIIVIGGKAGSSAVVDGAVAGTTYGDGYVDVKMNPTLLDVAD